MMKMGKNYIHINAGKVKLTKYDRMTGALSTNPADIRVCTETINGITRKMSTETYELPDGNSNYPAGIYEKGVKYEIGVEFSNLTSETLAFLKNAVLQTVSENMKEIVDTGIPSSAPYEIAALGNVTGTPIILDSNNQPFVKVASAPDINQYNITPGTTGTKQSMTKAVTTKASTAGTALITIAAAGSPALSSGKTVTVNLTTVDVATNASEIRSVLQSDPDIANYFDIGGADANANVTLTRKVAAAPESESFDFALGTAVDAVLGDTTAVVGIADVPAKFVFNPSNAGAPVTLEYDFVATGIEKYVVPQNATIPVVQMEIVHETLSQDKTTRYKNNSKISKMQLTGDISEDLAREHKPSTLNFTAIKPAGQNVIENKKVQIAL
jgi:hypothetical protein